MALAGKMIDFIGAYALHNSAKWGRILKIGIMKKRRLP